MTMDDFMALAKARRSCRAYRPDPVPEALIARVAEAGAWAASGMGMQSPIVVAVTQPAALETLRRINAEVMGASGSDPFYGAPCVLVTLAARERPTAVEDGSLALGNMMLAAEALGLGACWIHRARETFERPEAQALLSALGIRAEAYVGVGNLALGYRAGAAATPKPRKPDFLYWIR